jgi:hypothetical protein
VVVADIRQEGVMVVGAGVEVLDDVSLANPGHMPRNWMSLKRGSREL